MALSVFDEAGRPPGPQQLDAVLAQASPCWAALVAEVRRLAAADVDERWAFGGPKTGWSMRLVRGTRVLVYLTPQAEQALVGVVLGEKAIEAADARGIVGARTREVLEAAPRYAEGRGVRIPMATEDDLVVAVELVRIKLAR